MEKNSSQLRKLSHKSRSFETRPTGGNILHHTWKTTQGLREVVSDISALIGSHVNWKWPGNIRPWMEERLQSIQGELEAMCCWSLGCVSVIVIRNGRLSRWGQ